MLLRACSSDEDDEHVSANVLGHYSDPQETCSESLSMWCVWQKITRLLTTPMLPWVQCLRHGRPCQLRTADLDVSGFPCVDWSPAGKQLGIYGKTFEVLLALVAWHRSCRTPIVLLENVPEFNVQVLRFLVGDLYDVQARSALKPCLPTTPVSTKPCTGSRFRV